MDDWSKQFESLLSSPLGVELLSSLNEQVLIKYQEARKAQSSEQNRLLNQAEGLMLAIEHLQFRSFTPKDEGGKVK